MPNDPAITDYIKTSELEEKVDLTLKQLSEQIMRLYKSLLMGRMSLGIVDMCLYAMFALCIHLCILCFKKYVILVVK